MGKKQLDARNNGIIEGMYRSGSTPTQISNYLGYSVQTLDMDRQEGSGRPRITDERTDRHILLVAKANRFMHAKEIRSALGNTVDDTIILTAGS